VDYHYLSAAEFVKRRDGGEFLEWAEYGGSMYGTLEAQVDLAIEQRKHVILDIEVQGARQVRERRSDVVSIFILPPSAETLVKRLVGRDTSLDEDKLRQRLLRAVDELKEAPDYDYVVINEDRTQVVSEVAAIVDSESRRSHRDSELQENLSRLREDIGTLANKLAFE
jgi:guanylate kinase